MASDLMAPEDRVRLAAAHFMSGDRRVYCLGCGNLREPEEPPCTCRAHCRVCGEDSTVGDHPECVDALVDQQKREDIGRE